jgi:hypothetical protein
VGPLGFPGGEYSLRILLLLYSSRVVEIANILNKLVSFSFLGQSDGHLVAEDLYRNITNLKILTGPE